MSLSRAFDLAQWVAQPANVGDGVVVSALGPPFQGQFAPLVTGSKPGVDHRRVDADGQCAKPDL